MNDESETESHTEICVTLNESSFDTITVVCASRDSLTSNDYSRGSSVILAGDWDEVEIRMTIPLNTTDVGARSRRQVFTRRRRPRRRLKSRFVRAMSGTHQKKETAIEANGRVTTYTFPSVGIVTLDIKEYPLADISFDTLTAIRSTRGIKSATFELTNILRDENQNQAIVEMYDKEKL